MNIFSTEHPSPPPPKPWSRKKTITILLALIIAAILFLLHLDGPRVIARATAPDGTEFCVVQTCNWNLEFFTTNCYYRKPGGQWGQFYYDHQDWYWGRSRAEVDKAFECIKIYRDGQVTAAFYWESEKLRRFRNNFTLRESIGAHQWMPPGWTI